MVVVVLHIQDLRLLQIRAYLTKARLLGTPPHNFPTRGLTDLPILVRSKYDAGEATTRRDYFELHFETAGLRSVCANEFSVLCANEFCAHCALYLFRHLQNLHGCCPLCTPPQPSACLYAGTARQELICALHAASRGFCCKMPGDSLPRVTLRTAPPKLLS